ncbi:hypothetical protein GGR21_002937 [Dysgonomonas hofstadii]|uniref:Uncharacterized protein n=1 Tax=Dysgonomonas hofstadii TaxID=637886 RepID=A0A840CYK9_9BACT|nr:hypothetical protein [Dysgonomonas hofstadii]
MTAIGKITEQNVFVTSVKRLEVRFNQYRIYQLIYK